MPDLTETDRRLIHLLSEASDQWGALGVLTTAAQMWPAAMAVLTTPAVEASAPSESSEDSP